MKRLTLEQARELLCDEVESVIAAVDHSPTAIAQMLRDWCGIKATAEADGDFLIVDDSEV